MLEGFKSLPEGSYTLGYIPRPVAIVCVGENPFSVAHHMMINRHPFLYGFSCFKENYSRKLIEEIKDFSINFLPYKFLKDIYTAGKVHGNLVNKWEKITINKAKAISISSVIIPEAVLIYECEVLDIHNFFDHDLVIGRVIYKHYRKGKLSPHKVKYPLFLGKNYYSTNTRTIKMDIDET